MERQYAYGPGIDDVLVLFDKDGETYDVYYYLKDPLWTVEALVDENGNIVEAYAYEVYGEPTIKTGDGGDGDWFDGDETTASASAKGNPYLFTARRWDDDVSLQYNRARWYAPDPGRWLSRDPLGFVDGPNLYLYCRTNPVSCKDPAGTLCVGIGAGGSGTVAVPSVTLPVVPGLSVGYSTQLFFCTGSPHCQWCDTGSVTVMPVVVGGNITVSGGPVVTVGLGDQVAEGIGLSVGLGFGATFGTGQEVLIDVDIQNRSVTISLPRWAAGMSAYAAFRVTGTCTGCSPGVGSLFSTIRMRKVRLCLRAIQAAFARALNRIDGAVVPVGQAVTWRLPTGPLSVDKIPPEDDDECPSR